MLELSHALVSFVAVNWLRQLNHPVRALTLAILLGIFCPFGAGQTYIAHTQEINPIDAEKAFNEGDELFKKADAEFLRKAIPKYRQAAEIWHRANNRQRETEALSRIAATYFGLDEYGKAREYYNQSLNLCRVLKDQSCEAHSLNGIGRTYWATGDANSALDFYKQSLELRKATDNRSGEGYTLGNIGAIYLAVGEGEKAIEYFTRALSIMKQLENQDGQAFILYNIGLAYATRSESALALEHYERALALQTQKDQRAAASTLNNMGLVYASLGESEKALTHYKLSLAIRRKGGYRPGIAITLRNIGDIYAKQGENQTALTYYNEAIPLSEEVGDRRSAAYTLDSVGVVYWRLGDFRKSLIYFDKALSLFRKTSHKVGEATSLANSGSAYYSLGDYKKAMECYQVALPTFRQVADRPGEIRTLYDIARVQSSHNDFEAAYKTIQSALSIIENLRRSIPIHDLRASYFATIQDYYTFEIDVLMRLHKQTPEKQFDALALQANEQALARSLLDVLVESQIDIHEGADAQLLQKQKLLKQALDEKTNYRTRLLGNNQNPQQLLTAERDIDALTLQYEDVRSNLIKSHPHYSALMQPKPLTLNEIQQQVLDSDSLLLEYALGTDRSFLFAVTNSSISTFELPPRSDIERVATQLYDSLKARNQRPPNESPEQRAKRLTSADDQYIKAAEALSQIILVPVVGELGKKRLLIVASGALQYVPFAALPAPRDKRQQIRPTKIGGDSHPLIVDHEIINLPSASTLAVLRHEARTRRKATQSLLVFADPVFTRSDSRIKPASPNNKGGNLDLLTPDPLPRLMFSRDEAKNIIAVVPAKSDREASNFDATRSLALSKEAADYRIVHFATHTRIDSVRPERSEVMLSRFDESGESVNGSLSLSDIYNLRLSAELVVLSGCETALGKEIRGEGVIGLTRGFMYSGAPRIVSTLWRIDDRVSAELMKLFYEGMFKRGLSPAAALQAAQIAIWRRKNWQHPYYWAAFIIQGEPNRME
ncbi:MAG TPA: CHAT domain-containing protein [Pyrinomonadaceae bacterium]|nr:CHAT domain-containing protein [Pyrinomonadaceae bacterium]